MTNAARPGRCDPQPTEILNVVSHFSETANVADVQLYGVAPVTTAGTITGTAI